MIARLWHGWTTRGDSEAYASLLTGTILPELAGTEGCRGAYVLRRNMDGTEVEYAVLMLFEDMQAVKRLAGGDYERAVVPPEARALLSRYDERVTHYETLAYVSPPGSPR